MTIRIAFNSSKLAVNNDYHWAQKDLLNRTVLISQRNSGSDVAFLSGAGSEFHAVAAAAGNELSPSVERRVAGANNVALSVGGGPQAIPTDATGDRMDHLRQVPRRCSTETTIG